MNPLSTYLMTACSSTGQSTFYNTKKDQESALQAAHSNMLAFDRRLYVLSAALPITDRSKQLVLDNLLSTGSLCNNSVLEAQVISMVVSDMQFNRMLNMYMTLITKKTNNSRTRSLGRLLWEQVDAFRAIKYRSKIRRLLRHAHVAEGTDPARVELYKWVSGKITDPALIVHNPKLAARMRARVDYASLFELPFDIARDLAVNLHGKKAADFEKEFVGHGDQKGKGKASRKETMRARAHTGETNINFNSFDLFELFMYAHRNPGDQTLVLQHVEQKAKDIAATLRLPGKVAIVIDNSVSSLGSEERRFQPLAMMESVVHVCLNTDSQVTCHYVGPEMKDGLLSAEGCTNLRRPLVEALISRPDFVIIISDGYENVRSGSVAQILNTKAVRDSGIPVMHLNPVAAAESSDSRRLAQTIPTFALAAPAQLPMMALIGLAERDPKLLEPLFAEVEQCLLTGDHKAARLVTKSIGYQALPQRKDEDPEHLDSEEKVGVTC